MTIVSLTEVHQQEIDRTCRGKVVAVRSRVNPDFLDPPPRVPLPNLRIYLVDSKCLHNPSLLYYVHLN